MINLGQGHLLKQISGERLQDHWSSGFLCDDCNSRKSENYRKIDYVTKLQTGLMQSKPDNLNWLFLFYDNRIYPSA